MRIVKTGSGRQKKILLLRVCSILSFLSVLSHGHKRKMPKAQSSIQPSAGFYMDNNHLSFIVSTLITIAVLLSPRFSHHGRSKSGRTLRRWTEMFGKSPAFRKNRSSDGGK